MGPRPSRVLPGVVLQLSGQTLNEAPGRRRCVRAVAGEIIPQGIGMAQGQP